MAHGERLYEAIDAHNLEMQEKYSLDPHMTKEKGSFRNQMLKISLQYLLRPHQVKDSWSS